LIPMAEKDFKNLKNKLSSLIDDSFLFRMLVDERSELKNAVDSLGYSTESEKMLLEIIKLFEREHDLVSETSESLINGGNKD